MSNEPLWTIRELAQYLNYAESTVARMVSQCPTQLPPRVHGLGKPRWVPRIAEQWSINRSEPEINKRLGRPRYIK